jgi:uncharacterized membrane protein YdjX (TVP38/TMEM64 family)
MPPHFLLAFLLGAIYGTIFYTWQGQDFVELPLYLSAGVIGFGIGQLMGSLFNLNLFSIGLLHVVEATCISWFILFVAKWVWGNLKHRVEQ